MRKIIMYASISWKAQYWKKKVTWGDPDLVRYRGSPKDEQGRTYEVIEDKHTMFALDALQAPSEVTVTPMEREADTIHLKINRGFHAYVGNGFLYWETDDEAKLIKCLNL